MIDDNFLFLNFPFHTCWLNCVTIINWIFRLGLGETWKNGSIMIIIKIKNYFLGGQPQSTYNIDNIYQYIDADKFQTWISIKTQNGNGKQYLLTIIKRIAPKNNNHPYYGSNLFTTISIIKFIHRMRHNRFLYDQM